MIIYESIPDGYELSTEFPTYILGFCPDMDSWFATNQRFFFYEYPMDFPNKETAIEYFKRNPEVFYNLEKEMNIYRPSFNNGGVWLENTKELIMIKD